MAAAIGLSGCDSSDLETSNCTTTRLLVQDVVAAQPEELRLSARLETDEGQAVTDRRIDFGLARGPERTPDHFMAGVTDPAGVATADLAAEARTFKQVSEAVQNATVLVVDYRNPDALNDAKQPNYCSAKVIVGFDYTGPPVFSSAAN